MKRVLPLPVHVRLTESLKKTTGQSHFTFDSTVELDVKNRVEWNVVLIKGKNFYYAIVVDKVTILPNNQIEIPGAFGKRTFDSAIRKDDSGPCKNGCVVIQSFISPLSLSQFSQMGKEKTKCISYRAYLKFLAIDIFKGNLALQDDIERTNTFDRIKINTQSFFQSDTLDYIEVKRNPTQKIEKKIGEAHRTDFSNQNDVNNEISRHRDNSKAELKSQAESEDLRESSRSKPIFDLFLDVVKPNHQGAEYATGTNKEIAARLAGGLIKPLVACPSIASIEHLFVLYPNFTGVLNRVSRQLSLAKRANCSVPFKLAKPILMVGPPGVGKTCFSNALAEALGLPARKMDFSVQTASFVLTGSSCQWAESKQGIIAEELIMRSPVSNPMFILNEVDKVQVGDRSPLSSLLGLLDDTSIEFIDEFIGCDFPLNASYINYLLTANNLDNLSDALLTRVQVEWIPAPTTKEKIQIGQNIYTELLNAPWGDTFPVELNADALEALALSQNPREMKGRLIDALGMAAEQGANEVLIHHLDAVRKLKATIGFN